MNEEFLAWMTQQKESLEISLGCLLPPSTTLPSVLAEAMRYAALNHGKRIRPLLVSAASKLGEKADQTACEQRMVAVELLHSYSLIHDDLPVMDNDDMRHGKSACHKVFGEAMALLAGDALQALAFESLTRPNLLPAELNIQALAIFSRAVGFIGIVGGQALDILHTGNQLCEEELVTMHQKKTGALIETSVELGLLCCSKIDEQLYQQTLVFAQEIGLAFQIIDDLLDYQTSNQKLGKTAGKDQTQHKATFVTILGREKAEEKATALIEQAIRRLTPYLPLSQYLIDLACYIKQRDY